MTKTSSTTAIADARPNAGRIRKPFWRTRTLRYAVILCSAIGSVLLFLLASASSNSPFLERYYPILIGLNVLIALAMLMVVGTLVWRLAKRYRAGKFGARLMARFALAFALMGVLPGALIYLVSVQFLSRSIDTWFDVRVDKALESGLALGRTTLDGMLADLNGKARNIGSELSGIDESQQAGELLRLRERSGVQEAMLFTASGKIIATAIDATQPGSISFALGTLTPDMPSASVTQQLRLKHSYAALESSQMEAEKNSSPGLAAQHPSMRLRVIVPVPRSSLAFASDPLYLQLLQRVPQALADNAEEVQNGARDYQELSLSRTGLRKIYAVTLTLTLLLAIFAALATAFLLSTWLTAPLLQLAEGTRAVANGDYRPMQALHPNDELGSLTESFNTMTRQLDEARTSVERNRLQLVNAKTYLESILSNMSAGVLVFDAAFQLITANQAADRILGVPCSTQLGQRLAVHAALAPLDRAIEQAFAEQSEMSKGGSAAASGSSRDWQQQIKLERSAHVSAAAPNASIDADANSDAAADATFPALNADTVLPQSLASASLSAEPLTLLARGSRCPVGSGDEMQEGYLVVFDDVSDVIAAQRSIAWSEVARRLAHEIKNPLTPIQLSAERLQMKLHDRLDGNDAAVLERGVSTIVNQVTAMKNMVDDFRDYAKTPTAALQTIDLNALITEVLALYEFETVTNASASASSPASKIDARIFLQLGSKLPLILGDATRLRQVIHNLVQNAQDATHDRPDARVQVITERVDARIQVSEGIFTTSAKVLRSPREAMVRLTIIDNGPGFPPRILNRAFEPYVTSKARGTGLGLAVVKKIADEHEARIEVHNRSEGGARITLLFTRLASQHLRVA